MITYPAAHAWRIHVRRGCQSNTELNASMDKCLYGLATLLVQANTRCLPTFTDRAFQLAAPKLWNSLPAEIRNIQSLKSFKRALKMYFLKIAFNWLILKLSFVMNIWKYFYCVCAIQYRPPQALQHYTHVSSCFLSVNPPSYTQITQEIHAAQNKRVKNTSKIHANFWKLRVKFYT